jgi:hypothetical protein
MKPLTYYINFPISPEIQKYLEELSPDQKIELGVAIAQVAIDQMRQVKVNDVLVNVDFPDGIELASIEDVGQFADLPDFICEDCNTVKPFHLGSGDDELCNDCWAERQGDDLYELAVTA